MVLRAQGNVKMCNVQCAVCNTHAVCSVQCMCSVQCTECSVQCAVHACAVFNGQSAECIVQSAIRSVQCTTSSAFSNFYVGSSVTGPISAKFATGLRCFAIYCIHWDTFGPRILRFFDLLLDRPRLRAPVPHEFL